MVEQCLVLIKPDGMVKNIAGDVINRFAETKLQIVGAKTVEVTRELAEEHYQHLKDREFYEDLLKYIMGEYHVKTVLALVYEGKDACKIIREAAGATNPEEAHPTTVRGKYGRITTKGIFENVVHASESPSEGEREIKLWFRPEELSHVLYPTETKEITTTKEVWKEE